MEHTFCQGGRETEEMAYSTRIIKRRMRHKLLKMFLSSVYLAGEWLTGWLPIHSTFRVNLLS
jgi:hypothetical protein